MKPLLEWLVKVLNPQQICVLCLLATAAMAGYGVRTFANNKDVTAIKVELLQSRLLDLRIEQCKAIKSGQPSRFFAGQVQEQIEKYRVLTGQEPPLPSCEEI